MIYLNTTILNFILKNCFYTWNADIIYVELYVFFLKSGIYIWNANVILLRSIDLAFMIKYLLLIVFYFNFLLV